MTSRFALAVLLIALPVAVQAQSLSLRDKMTLNKACGADIAAVCGHVEPGSGLLGPCLKDNVDQLSTVCVETLAAFRDQLEAMQPEAVPPAAHGGGNS